MRIFSAIKWLFTNAPLNITSTNEEYECDYCSSTDIGVTHYPEVDLKICHKCRKEAYDKILGNERLCSLGEEK